jgi:hypothetical protein
MALSGFASGALVASPIAAVLTWLAVTYQQHVDVRVERDTVAVRADRAAFDQTFERDWNAMSGSGQETCDPESTAELVRLRTRLGELEAKLEGSSDTLEADAEELRQLVAEEGR